MDVEYGASLFMEIAKLWGLPYALFIGMLLYVLYKNDKREISYQKIIEKYGDAIDTKVDEIRRDVADIKRHTLNKY